MCIQKVRNIMKIRNIKIKGLYDIYDYDLDFFEDVTFLHGINGSGKTTILEIISNIISGNLSYLLKYLFEEIVLSYTNKNGYEETIMMNIIKDEKVIKLVASFREKKYSVWKNIEFKNIDSPLTNEIRDEVEFRSLMNLEFPVVYLPVLRMQGMEKYIAPSKDFIRYSLNSFNIDNIVNLEINKLLEFKTKLSYSLNIIDNRLLKKILEAIVISESDLIDDLKQEIYNSSEEELRNKISQYKNALNELSQLYHLELHYDEVLSDLGKELVDFKRRTEPKKGLTLKLGLNFYKLVQAQKIMELYNSFKEQKVKIEKPLQDFIKIINDFYDTGYYGKKILFSEDGTRLEYISNSSTKEKRKNLTVERMSSGEKQIFILLANLVINLSNNSITNGIYIIDEPELSLHIEWQEKLVDSIFLINPNVQLIFATHSPDIISRYGEKAIRLTHN